MTKLRDLFKNVVGSVDNLFVLFSKLFGYLVIILIIWAIYRWLKNSFEKKTEFKQLIRLLKTAHLT